MKQIKERLEIIVKQLYRREVLVELVVAPEGMADWATNIALKLAKEIGKSPREIAEEIKGEFKDEDLGVEIEVAGPGFLNFRFKDEFLKDKLAKLNKNFVQEVESRAYLGKRVVVEFSDPNPFKVLHVGHLYTSIVGDTISRLVEFAGGEVMRANFGGDVGLHVAKTMYVMLRRKEEIEGLAPEKRAEWMAECYVEGTRLYEEDEGAKGEIGQLNKELYRVSREKDKESELGRLYFLGREWSYDYFKKFYQRVGVKFDKYYPESTVADLGLVKVREGLEKGVYEESEGAVVYRGEKIGLHTRVFINKAGLPTYEAKDVGLIFQKWMDFQFDQSVVITGNDIVDYMKVVLASIGEYAPELAKRTLHLTHGNVRLPGNEKMSSRKGNFLKAVEVLMMVEENLKSEYGSLDQKVALSAVKYAFLKYKIGGNIIFEVKDSVSMSGNSGPYLQYAAVRAKKILNGGKSGGRVDYRGWELSKAERDLMRKILKFKEVVEVAVGELAPHKICEYLYELAQNFSRFYEQEKVVGSEREAERKELVRGYLLVMEQGLGLLGIEIPEQM